MVRLIHINGLPGSGKSTLARRVAAKGAGVVVIDIDLLRTQIPRWQAEEQSMVEARAQGIREIEAHVTAGSDVIVPQFVGRVDFVEQLGSIAQASGAEFVEWMLEIDVDLATQRFTQRRAQLRIAGDEHPEGDVADGDIRTTIEAAASALALLRGLRPTIAVVSDDGAGRSGPTH